MLDKACLYPQKASLSFHTNMLQTSEVANKLRKAIYCVSNSVLFFKILEISITLFGIWWGKQPKAKK